jgi:hypothetical protein
VAAAHVKTGLKFRAFISKVVLNVTCDRHAKPVLVKVRSDGNGRGGCRAGRRRSRSRVAHWHVTEVLGDPGRNFVCGGAAEYSEAHVRGDVVSLVETNKVIADDLKRGKSSVI